MYRPMGAKHGGHAAALIASRHVGRPRTQQPVRRLGRGRRWWRRRRWWRHEGGASPYWLDHDGDGLRRGNGV